MVFRKKEDKEVIFDGYLSFLKEGKPAAAWSYSAHGVYLTGENLLSYVGREVFNEEAVRAAKAKGNLSRYEHFISLLDDPKTAVAQVSVLRAIEEIFFSEALTEIPQKSILFDAVYNQIKQPEAQNVGLSQNIEPVTE